MSFTWCNVKPSNDGIWKKVMVVTKVQYCRMSGHMKLIFMVPRNRVIKLTGNPLGNKQTCHLHAEKIRFFWEFSIWNAFYFISLKSRDQIYLIAIGFGTLFVSKVKIEYRCCTVLVHNLCSPCSFDFSSGEHLSPKIIWIWLKKVINSKTNALVLGIVACSSSNVSKCVTFFYAQYLVKCSVREVQN